MTKVEAEKLVPGQTVYRWSRIGDDSWQCHLPCLVQSVTPSTVLCVVDIGGVQYPRTFNPSQLRLEKTYPMSLSDAKGMIELEYTPPAPAAAEAQAAQ